MSIDAVQAGIAIWAVGTPIGGFDAMTAAHARAVDAVVVTANTKHFGRVPGLLLDNWLGASAGH
jgi:tRNA(fMet)-specific endonuclease VapC